MKVNILGPNLNNGHSGEMHVHAVGCADIKRSPIYRGLHPMELQWITEIASERELVEAIWSDQIDESGSDWNDYRNEQHIFPCVGELPVEPAADPIGALAALLSEKVAEAQANGATLDEAITAVRQLWIEAAS